MGDCVGSALASEGGRTQAKRKDEVKVQKVVPAVSKVDIILRINRDLTVGTL